MKNRKILLHLFLPVLTLYLLIASFRPVFGQSENQFFISNINCSLWPVITLQVRGIDANGNVIPTDQAGSGFEIYENNQLVLPESIQPLDAAEGPKYVIFSLDLGKDSNFGKLFASDIQRVMQTFADSYFTEDKDIVQIVSHTNNGVQNLEVPLSPTTKKIDFDNAINHLNLSPSLDKLQGLQGLNDLYAQLVATTPGRYNMVIIHFSRFIEGIDKWEGISLEDVISDATNLGGNMASQHIRVYIVSTDQSGGAITFVEPPFRALTEASGGGYIPLLPGNQFPSNELTNVYKIIDQNSQVYPVQFLAQKWNATYKIMPIGVADATDSQICTDALPLEPPKVEITEPFGVSPTITLGTNQKTITVTAELQGWSENNFRQIIHAELLVNGDVVDPQDFAPGSHEAAFTFDVNLSPFLTTGSGELTLQVRVVDNFDKEGKSSEVLYTVVAPPPDGNRDRGEEIPGFSGVPGGSSQTEPSICNMLFSLSCIGKWLLARLAWIILILLLVIVIVLYNLSEKVKNVAAPARKAASTMIKRAQETWMGITSSQPKARASLRILVPQANDGIVNIYDKLTLGRDPNMNIQLYQPEDESSVSREHCTIYYDGIQNKFFITDHRSSNGTYLNGKRLDAEQPYGLADRAEITLGDLHRQGAKVQFELVNEPDNFPDEMEPVTPLPPIEDSDDDRQTVPGYRDGDEAYEDDSTDIFREPSVEPLARQRPLKQKPKDNQWIDELG
jgi:hypothetical protein